MMVIAANFKYSEFTEEFNKVKLDEEKGDLKLEDFEYQGFDPAHFFSLLVKKAEVAKRDSKGFIKDMVIICSFVLIRGIRHDKATKRMNKDGKERIETLVKRYGVTATKDTSRDAIILSRFPATFPQITAKLIKEGIVDVRIAHTSAIDDFLQFPQAPAIIPKAETELFNKWLEWAVEFDKVINPDKPNPDNVKRYGKIAWESNFIDNDERIKIVRELRV